MKSSRRELTFVLIVGAAVACMNLAPYLYGYLTETQEKLFVGTVSDWPEDTFHHLSFARQAERGDLLFEPKFYGDQIETRLIFNSLMLALGGASRLTSLPLDLVFHLERVLLTFLFFFVAHRFVSLFFERTRQRLVAVSLIAFSSGFGWLHHLGIMGSVPADLLYVEVTSNWHLRWEVICTPVVILLLTVFTLFIRYLETGFMKYAIGAGAATMLLATIHLQDLVVVFSVTGVVLALKLAGDFRRNAGILKGYLVIGLMQVPFAAYVFYVIHSDPALWTYVDVVIPFGPFSIFLGYGLLSLLGIIGIAQALRGSSSARLDLCLVWLVLAVAFLYIPLPLLRRPYLLHGLHIVLCIFSIHALVTLAGHAGRWLRVSERSAFNAIAVAFVIFSSITTVFQVRSEIQRLERKPFPYFVHKDVAEGLDWLKANSSSYDLVFSSMDMNTMIPYWTGNRVYAFTNEEAADFLKRVRFINRVFAPDRRLTPVEIQEKLRKRGADYLFLKTADRDDGTVRELLDAYSEMNLVYSNDTIYIFRLRAMPARAAG
jgi:hypothetical protein